MSRPFSRYHNNCPRCPVLGAEDIPSDEYYNLKWMRLNINIAREMVNGRTPVRVEPGALKRWLEHTRIDPQHVTHVPLNVGPGLKVTLPGGCGEPIIDGNHRAARSLREGKNFFVYVFDEAETLQILRRSMGTHLADLIWSALAESRPHPDDL
ncbi:hypothetical protein [Granulicella sp. L60]|uniref:hypothetical protein n=1 Tax=Granulicella sp. L60 TaxID=1641866 RepID=UPI00131B9FA1|nr:hypothetical protein [Granulicella sp. L60]